MCILFLILQDKFLVNLYWNSRYSDSENFNQLCSKYSTINADFFSFLNLPPTWEVFWLLVLELAIFIWTQRERERERMWCVCTHSYLHACKCVCVWKNVTCVCVCVCVCACMYGGTRVMCVVVRVLGVVFVLLCVHVYYHATFKKR